MNSLYFIMDICGYYYRVNERNQLVVAKDREQAGRFTFIEANQRIGGGKKARFYTAVLVEEVEKDNDKLTEVEQMQMVEFETNREGVETYDLSKVDWLEYLRSFEYLSGSVKKYQDELAQKLSDVDSEICDLMHLVELYELSESESMRVIENLKECREYRRVIKDEMFKSECFQTSIGTNGNVTKVKQAIKQIEKLDSRKYTPRKRPDLFVGAVMRVNKKECETEIVQKQVENGGNDNMEYIRQTTIFDNGNFDIKSFVKQQMEFFKDARQHMVNLNIELDEIENEIDATMSEIENANYNVAQGYKVFKKLKDLRGQRTAKIRELSCFSTVVENFDCTAMEVVLRRSLKEIENNIEADKTEETTLMSIVS